LARQASCPLTPPPAYGCEALLEPPRLLRVVSILVVVVPIVVAGIVFLLYVLEGDKELLIGVILPLAFLPVDIALVRYLLSNYSVRALELVRGLVESVGFDSYAILHGGGGMIWVVGKAGDWHLLFMFESSTRGILVAVRPSSTRVAMTRERFILPSLLGWRATLGLSLRRILGEYKSLIRPSRGCLAVRSRIQPGVRLVVPSPTLKEWVELSVADGVVYLVSCPLAGGRRLAHSLAVAAAEAMGLLQPVVG